MTGSVISEPIRRLTVVTSVILKEISRRLSADLLCPNCGNSDPKTVDVVKRTCGYLETPQARPMVNGRHRNRRTGQTHEWIHYQISWTPSDRLEKDIMGKYQLDDKGKVQVQRFHEKHSKGGINKKTE